MAAEHGCDAVRRKVGEVPSIMLARGWRDKPEDGALQSTARWRPSRIKEKTSSGLKDGLIKSKLNTGMSKKRSAVVTKKSFMRWSRVRLAKGLHERDSTAVGWFPPLVKKKKKKAEKMEMYALGIEVGDMQFEKEIEKPVEICFEDFTHVCLADLQEEERNDEWRDHRNHMEDR
jgi:hypothetical protein